jgi:hypothetical protein
LLLLRAVNIDIVIANEAKQSKDNARNSARLRSRHFPVDAALSRRTV